MDSKTKMEELDESEEDEAGTGRRIRVTKGVRKRILQIADEEDLDPSDVISDALDAYEDNEDST